MDDSQLAAVDDGRVFTGRQGVGLHLVDALGEERDAIAYLQNERHVSRGLPILDWKPEGGFGGFKLFSSAAALARVVGFGPLADALEGAGQLADARALDGLLSVWQVR